MIDYNKQYSHIIYNQNVIQNYNILLFTFRFQTRVVFLQANIVEQVITPAISDTQV